MSIEGFFFNSIKNGDVYDRPYNAEDFTTYLDGVVSSGVFAEPSTSLQVIPGTKLTVIVSEGKAWVNGVKIKNTAEETYTLDTADVVLNRIDRIVAYVDYSQRLCGIRVKKGTAAITPVPPTLKRDSITQEYCLAEIRINKQITQITQSMITDTRPNNDVCGWVTSLIDQVDTSTLFAQYETAYAEQFTKNQSTFNAWFDTIKNEIHKAVPVQITKKEYISTAGQKTISIPSIIKFNKDKDYIDIYINGYKLTSSEYTYTSSVVTLTNALLVGNVIELHVTQCVQ